MPTLAIVGAGPGLGLAVARRFGREGYDVALIARNSATLSTLVDQLTSEGVTAGSFVADVTDRVALIAALEAAAARFGRIDVLEFSPYAPADSFSDILATDLEGNVVPQVQGILLGGIASATTVLPAMLEAGAGTLLFTGGIGSLNPLSILPGTNAAQAGLRNYVHNLHQAVADRGVYAAWIAIGMGIGGSFGESAPSVDPDDLAAAYWDLHVTRTQVEHLVVPS